MESVRGSWKLEDGRTVLDSLKILRICIDLIEHWDMY